MTTPGTMARAGVPGEGSSGAGEAEPAGESHAAGVRFPSAPRCPCVSEQARLAGALDLRLPVSQGKPLRGQGPVRIRAVPVPAQPQPAASPSAAERSWVPPCQAVPAGPGATNRDVKGCVSCCRGDSPTGNGNAVLGESLGHRPEWVASTRGQNLDRAFLEVPGRGRQDVQALHHQDNWQPPSGEGDPDAPRPPGARPVPASRSLSRGWQGCAAGHGRRRTPAPLSDSAG